MGTARARGGTGVAWAAVNVRLKVVVKQGTGRGHLKLRAAKVASGHELFSPPLPFRFRELSSIRLLEHPRHLRTPEQGGWV